MAHSSVVRGTEVRHMLPHKHHPSTPDLVVEIAEQTLQKIEKNLEEVEHDAKDAKHVMTGLKTYHGVKAFKHFDVSHSLFGLGKNENFRAVVINKRAKAIFDAEVEYSKQLQDVIEDIEESSKKSSSYFAAAAWLIAIAKSHKKYSHIWEGKGDRTTKVLESLGELGTATNRCLAGNATAMIDLVAKRLEKDNQFLHGPPEWTRNIKKIDLRIHRIVHYWTDTKHIADAFYETGIGKSFQDEAVSEMLYVRAYFTPSRSQGNSVIVHHSRVSKGGISISLH